MIASQIKSLIFPGKHWEICILQLESYPIKNCPLLQWSPSLLVHLRIFDARTRILYKFSKKQKENSSGRFYSWTQLKFHLDQNKMAGFQTFALCKRCACLRLLLWCRYRQCSRQYYYRLPILEETPKIYRNSNVTVPITIMFLNPSEISLGTDLSVNPRKPEKRPSNLWLRPWSQYQIYIDPAWVQIGFIRQRNQEYGRDIIGTRSSLVCKSKRRRSINF